jgi:glutamate/tyrosine decarboxylase-like PLP-dependent enzyme
MPDHTLTLSPEQMRAVGYRVVEMLVDHFTTLPDQRVMNVPSRAAMEAALRTPFPEQGTDPLDVLERLRREVLAHISHVDHPRFFGFVPGPGNFIGVMAEALSAGFNIFAGTWIESAGPTTVELVVMDWLRQVCGLPETAGGLCVSGGSMANLTALAVARHIALGGHRGDALVYYSDQTHSSVERALRVLGFAPEQLRKLPTDASFRLDLAALQKALTADAAAGGHPFCIVANAGTTNTGAVDPLRALAELCRERGLWLHVDGAYGAAVMLCNRGPQLLDGLGAVDSLALDAHKWLFQPYEIGCVLVRDRTWLRQTFHILPEYMHDTVRDEAEVNLCDYGLQLTRSFRALKLWLSFQAFGREAFAAAIERGLVLAEAAEAYLRTLPHWEVASPARMGIIAFRHVPPGWPPEHCDAWNRTLATRLADDGFAFCSTTVLRGRTVLRLCPLNPRTTEADVYQTLDRLAALARQPA